MILVTGGTGFLGKRVVRSLLSHSCGPIKCLVRPGTPVSIFDDLGIRSEPEEIEVLQASFNDMTALQSAVQGVDTVIHLASSLAGSAAAQVANTVVGTDNLMNVCVKADIKRFVLCSSFGVIEAATVKRRGVIDENTPMETHPEARDAYSFSKQMQEKLAWDYHNEKGLPVVVIRPGVIFGAPQPILSGRVGLNLFGFFLHLGLNNKIPLTYKDNCADALVKAAITEGIDGEIFCLVDDDIPTSHFLLERYKKEIAPVRSIPIPYRCLKVLSRLNELYTERTQGHLPAVFTPYKVDSMWKGHNFSNQKAKDKLQWTPNVSMQDALDKTFDYLQNGS